MSKPVLKLNVQPGDYAGLLILAQQVKEFLTANIGLYPTPNPTLVTLTTHITALAATKATWSLKNNRGSHPDFVALKVAANDVRNDLLLLGAYVVNTVDNTLNTDVQLANLLDSGFTVKNVRSKVDVYGAVQNLRMLIKKNITEPNVPLRWKKPQQQIKGTSPKSYNVYKNGVFMATVTKTSLLVVRPTGPTPDNYTITAISDLGEGAPKTIKVATKGA